MNDLNSQKHNLLIDEIVPTLWSYGRSELMSGLSIENSLRKMMCLKTDGENKKNKCYFACMRGLNLGHTLRDDELFLLK